MVRLAPRRRRYCCAILFGAVVALPPSRLSTTRAFQFQPKQRCKRNNNRYNKNSPCHTICRASKNNNKSNNNVNKTKQSSGGVYVRPSAAVERGSGFFFPGLEGPRVRLVVGGLLLVVTGVNHVLSSSTSTFSEALAVLYSLLVLIQGAIETSKEGRQSLSQAVQLERSSSEEATESSSRNASQHWSSSTSSRDDSWKDRVEWAAASYLALTPATHMILLRGQDGGSSSSQAPPVVEYWLGVTGTSMDEQTSRESTTTTTAAVAALQTIQQSTSGRVALPSDHPAVVGGILPDEFRRCVLLQRISSSSSNSDSNADISCFIVASNDLLASYTKQDLQWLGQLARYVNDGTTNT